MIVRSALALLVISLSAPAAAQDVPVPGVPTKDILAGTLDQGRMPMLSLCDRVREWHADRAFARPRHDRAVKGRELFVVDASREQLLALRGEGLQIDGPEERDRSECNFARASVERASTLGELDRLFARVAPEAAWAPSSD